MTPRDARRLLLIVLCACQPSATAYPWPAQVTARAFEHAEVRTRNAGYDRMHSRVLVREIDRPTRANLDYAAYHANFMIAEEAPEVLPASGAPDVEHPFGGLVDRKSWTADITKTPLSEAERRRPLAFASLLEFALARKVAGADALEAVASAVRSEAWGLPSRPGSASQTIAEVFLHELSGGAKELWLRIEFAPWFKALGALPDQDRDGVAELYAKLASAPIAEPLVALIRDDYCGHVFDAAELKNWANQLASYWYPSFNTDLVQADASWPDSQTEADIRGELGGNVFDAPAVVMRGKPQGQPTYAVFLVHTDSASPAASAGAAVQLPKSKPSPDLQRMAARIRGELAAFGPAGWLGWNEQLKPFQAAVRRKLKTQPAAIKTLPGDAGFLFFRTSLESIVGGEIDAQAAPKNPLPSILEWKRLLDAHGVDFLFVPVPSKEEVYPDALDPAFKNLVGQVVHPALRRFLLTLEEQGVEVVDLLTPLLAARAAGDASDQEPLYQRQDTHWTDRGLRLAAQVLAERVERYPWYAALSRHAQPYTQRSASFTRFGDLHSRLPEALKRKYQPEQLRAQQVLRADGSAYEDDPDSPITVLGDSFTGVYELTDAEHAGVSAHLARGIAYPVDLVMSYGGGPNVRNKLMRRGAAALGQKKLVIWVMAARDLYDYEQGWEPLAGAQ